MGTGILLHIGPDTAVEDSEEWKVLLSQKPVKHHYTLHEENSNMENAWTASNSFHKTRGEAA
jgi:hypothetical protein